MVLDDDDKDSIEEIPDTEDINILSQLENTERITFLTTFLKKLSERKRLVMTLYYYENLTFKDIGKVINVSESRVCQIHSQVIEDLKVKLKHYDDQ
jgi:RNA polymerase sigma factor for flagellar operon FliA